jgi:GTP-binding protein
VKFTAVEFVTSARSASGYPPERLPEIAIAGRSNVGKSSLINALLKRRGVAKVSGTPGKTRGINYFRINGSFYLVDLPGYGYAKVSEAERRSWDRMIREYFAESTRRRLVIMLVDIRHAPSALDRTLREWLEAQACDYLVVATKADKLSGNARAASLRILQAAYPGREILPFSSVTEMGRRELLGWLQRFIRNDQSLDI